MNRLEREAAATVAGELERLGCRVWEGREWWEVGCVESAESAAFGERLTSQPGERAPRHTPPERRRSLRPPPAPTSGASRAA